VDGMIILNKPHGVTSHQCVAAVRLLVPGVKVGHAGTLDPAATGVLPLCLGKATRIVEFLMDQRKGYRAGVQLGVSTDTEDAQGEVVNRQPVPPLDTGTLKTLLQDLAGEQEQVPPAYSAVKHRGRPLYYWARRGKQVQKKPRRVTIYRVELLEYNPSGRPHLTLQIDCSRGTYIRSLAAEIGRRLGCGAHLWSLERNYVGPFTLQEAATLAELQEAAARGGLQRFIRPMDQALRHLPALTLDRSAVLHLKHGRPVECNGCGAENLSDRAGALPLRIYGPEGHFYALARREKAGSKSILKTVKYLATTAGEQSDGNN